MRVGDGQGALRTLFQGGCPGWLAGDGPPRWLCWNLPAKGDALRVWFGFAAMLSAASSCAISRNQIHFCHAIGISFTSDQFWPFHVPRRTIYLMVPLPIYDRIRLMQLMALSAGRGLTWWNSGHVRIERIDAFVEKMIVHHGVNADRSGQRHRRAAGLPRARLMILKPKDGDTHAGWWMLATANLPGEQMRDAAQRNSRIVLGASFELVRLTTRGNGTCWTWRVKPCDWAEFERRGIHYARAKNKAPAQKFMDGLAKWPGAAGLNAQRRELFRTMQSKAKGALIPPRILYPRFLSLATKPITQDATGL